MQSFIYPKKRHQNAIKKAIGEFYYEAWYPYLVAQEN